MSEQLIGSAMDSLGVTLDLDEGDVIEKVVVIALTRNDGSGDLIPGRQLYTGVSRDVDWMDQYMLLKLGAKFALGDGED